jgi:hypothetical protein
MESATRIGRDGWRFDGWEISPPLSSPPSRATTPSSTRVETAFFL